MTILKKNQVSRQLFLSANVHQGDELFSIQSRGKQCAFISLSATHNFQCAIISHCSSAWSQSTFIILMPWYKEADIVHESSE